MLDLEITKLGEEKVAKQKNLEEKLNDVFVKNAPFQIPDNGRKAIVRYLPWINLVLAVLIFLSAWWLWQWTRTADHLTDLFNDVSRLYGTNTEISTSRLTTTIWISLVILLFEGVLYLAAFPGLRDRKKQGWNLLFYLAILNIVYGVVVAFTDYGSGFGSLIFSAIGSIIGLYILFQIRGSYHDGKSSPVVHNTAKSHKTS